VFGFPRAREISRSPYRTDGDAIGIGIFGGGGGSPRHWMNSQSRTQKNVTASALNTFLSIGNNYPAFPFL